MKILPGNEGAERRIYLERYLRAWLLDHALTVGDLARQEVRDRLLKALSGDLGAILGKSADAIAGQIGLGVMKIGAGLLQKGAAKLLGMGGGDSQERRR